MCLKQKCNVFFQKYDILWFFFDFYVSFLWFWSDRIRIHITINPIILSIAVNIYFSDLCILVVEKEVYEVPMIRIVLNNCPFFFIWSLMRRSNNINFYIFHYPSTILTCFFPYAPMLGSFWTQFHFIIMELYM